MKTKALGGPQISLFQANSTQVTDGHMLSPFLELGPVCVRGPTKSFQGSPTL